MMNGPTELTGRRRHLVIGLALLGGLVLSVALFRMARTWEQERTRAEFRRAAEGRVWAVRKEMSPRLLILESLGCFFAGSQKVERHEFGDFAAPMLRNHPDIQALEWPPLCPTRTALPTAGFLAGTPTWEARCALMAGLLLTGLAAAYLWRATRHAARLAEDEEHGAACPAPGEGFDEAAALEQADGDEGLLVKLAELFLEHHGKWLADLRDALDGGDCGQVEQVAHRIKSAMGNLAARGAFEAALNLEGMGRREDLTRAQEAWRQLDGEVAALRRGIEAFLEVRSHAGADC